MGFRREIKIRFLIIMVITLVLGGCLSNRMLLSSLNSDEDYNRSQSGKCSVKQMWVKEHISESVVEQVRNSPFKLDSRRDSRELTASMDQLLKYMFLDGQPKISEIIEQPGNVPFHQVSRRQQDSYPSWTRGSLDDDFCNQLSVVILVLLLGHTSALIQMSHLLTALTRKHSSKSENCDNTSAKTFLFASNFLSSSMVSLGIISYTNKDSHSKDRKKHDWLKDPLRRFGHFTKYAVYSVLERVASYRPFAFDRMAGAPSAVTLAEAGFLYPGVGSAVQCQGCKSLVEIENFKSPAPATAAKYHREGCSFVTMGSLVRGNEEFQSTEEIDTDSAESEDEATSNVSNTSDEPLQSRYNDVRNESLGTLPAALVNEQLNNLPNEDSTCPEAAAWQIPQAAFSTGNEHEFAEPLEQNSEQTAASGYRQGNETATWECEQMNQVLADTQQQTNEVVTGEYEQRDQLAAGTQQAHSSLENMGACANPVSSEQRDAFISLLFDPSVFDTEAEVFTDGVNPREACQKNPGHYGNFPMWQLQLDYIPSNVRCPEMLQFFKLIGKLVVKLTIRATSRDRPHYAENIGTVRFGTGIAFVKEDNDTPAPEPFRRWNSIRRYMPGFKKNKGVIYIKTNHHLVFDAFEAQNTVVEFFFDNPNRGEIVQAKGVSITHSSIVGDATSVLQCKISDLSMVEFVKNTENEVNSLVRSFPQRIKEGLTKRVFVISHPHGEEKIFSYGEYAMVKYALKMEKKRDGQQTPEIVKINNHTQISKNSDNIRKMLFYTADTCKGSSGGLVVSFKKTKVNNTEDIQLELWMHSGVEKKHGLNASAMKELTPDDIANHGNISINRPSVQDEQEAEADAASRQVVSGPVFTVIGPPAHPAYVPYMKRFLSYPTPFNHVHTAADLADAGFFFANYADCVRCFQCGLGLRSWRPGDSIYEEHGKNRPDCSFLQMKMRANGISRQGFQPNNQQNNSNASAQTRTSPPQSVRGAQQNQQLKLPLKRTGSSENSSEEENETQLLKPTNDSLPVAQQEPASALTFVGSRNDEDCADVPRSMAVSVLQREQKYLKQMFTCKVCFVKPVKDLFLPCGELVACLECSKLLTHCPSCNKKILATVTTYFS